MKKEDSESDELKDSEEVAKCDLESEAFDAQTSLSSGVDQVVIPVPNAHTFNNIEEYFSKSFGKMNASKHLPSISGSKVPVIERTLKLIPCTSVHPRRELPTILTRMRGAVSGPNSLLLKSLNKRIKVLIRRRKSVKLFSERFGWITGLLIAFDKHHNLCMTDVDEKYQKLDQNNEIKDVNNYVKQLFIRGDNIVLIGFV